MVTLQYMDLSLLASCPAQSFITRIKSLFPLGFMRMSQQNAHISWPGHVLFVISCLMARSNQWTCWAVIDYKPGRAKDGIFSPGLGKNNNNTENAIGHITSEPASDRSAKSIHIRGLAQKLGSRGLIKEHRCLREAMSKK